MNDVGILVDLSHVGGKTAKDVIDVSKRPVAYTHCCPSALKKHPRNKSDEDLRYIVDRGGFVGVAGVPSFLPRELKSTIDDYADAIRHIANVIGEDRIGMGTDITQNQKQDFFDYIASDKGYGRQLVDLGGIPILGGFETLKDYNNIIDALKRKKFTSRQIDKIVGENWLKFLGEVWV
jgi:membrane dipeptidase